MEFLLQPFNLRQLLAEDEELTVRYLHLALGDVQPTLGHLRCLLKGLQTEELLKDLQPLRGTIGAQLFHLLLPDEGGVPKAVVIQADDVLYGGLQLWNRAPDGLPVPLKFEIR